MNHHLFCSRKYNLDVEFHFTKIGRAKLKLYGLFSLRFVLEDISRRTENLYKVSSNFQLQKMNVSILIFQGVNRNSKYIFLTLRIKFDYNFSTHQK